MIERFLACMKAQGWYAETRQPPPLPKWITDRYHNPPELWLQFVGTVSELFSGDETTWFLCAEDYDSRLDHAFWWNEWERLSLQNAEGDEIWAAEIKTFWDNHLPIVMSVGDRYSYYAISMTDGRVVYGSEPEFEACQTVASSFEHFLDQVREGTIAL